MQKVAKNHGLSRKIRAFPFNKYRCPEITAYTHSPDTMLPYLTPPATSSIPLNAYALKALVWRTAFVSPHTHTHTHTIVITPKVSAEYNLRRETLIKMNP
jgi:hypothetical protein